MDRGLFPNVSLEYERVFNKGGSFDAEPSLGEINTIQITWIKDLVTKDIYCKKTQSVVSFGGNIGYIVDDTWNFFTEFNSN